MRLRISDDQSSVGERDQQWIVRVWDNAERLAMHWCESDGIESKHRTFSPYVKTSVVHCPFRSTHVDRSHDQLGMPTGYVRYNRGVLTTTNGSTLGISCNPSLLVIPDSYKSGGSIGVSVYGNVGTVAFRFL